MNFLKFASCKKRKLVKIANLYEPAYSKEGQKTKKIFKGHFLLKYLKSFENQKSYLKKKSTNVSIWSARDQYLRNI